MFKPIPKIKQQKIPLQSVSKVRDIPGLLSLHDAHIMSFVSHQGGRIRVGLGGGHTQQHRK